ncbi:hypothetical protein DL93DRAFT_2082369 [Clavulina sp. PMI_390]|nr:hypothetical protein DL93DRAFT_2082369 [Clavulina sp. PMI_390]
MSKEHWQNFFATQKRLEIFECPCRILLVEQISSISKAFPRLRFLHLGAEYAFDGEANVDVCSDDIRFLGNQLETLRPHISTELAEYSPGLRILVQIDEETDWTLLPTDFPLSRFRVTPLDEPWNTCQ